jgi:AAA+ superfamily predicted ATPase
VAEAAAALQRAPGDPQARALMVRAMGASGDGDAPAAQQPTHPGQPTPPAQPAHPGRPTPPARPEGPPILPVRPIPPAEPPAARPERSLPSPTDAFDWKAAEAELSGVIPPRFTDGGGSGEDGGDGGGDAEPESLGDGEDGSAGGPLPDAWDVESAGTVRLADVGGMAEVKQRLEAAFLAPLRNPELRRLYGKSMRGGLLLYGPPGCGKTFVARAVAGELGAKFMAVGLSDVLDMWIGASERNLHELFETARRNAPCVLFLDELDALGAKRSGMRHSGLRNSVNQLLSELDGVDAEANEGVFVLAATNHPWDVDTALRRPGRLDRTLLVLPPDEPAREAILRYHLRDRPVAGVELGAVVRRTDGYSGADLQHVCETAAERALMDSVASGSPRMIGTPDLLEAVRQVKPSTGPWFETARNVATFANESGTYDDLLAYLKHKRRR